MNLRRIIYVAFIMFILIWLWQNGGFYEQKEEMAIISKGRVMNWVAEKYEEEDGLVLYFPLGYRGMEGEVFYLTVVQGSQIHSDKYRIVRREAEPSTQLDLSLEQSWEDIHLPINKFEVYSLEQGEWMAKT